MEYRKNQIITTASVLPYKGKDGSIRYLAKEFDNLKKFHGIKVPITMGHPKGGLVGTATKILGHTTLKICDKIKGLCADIPKNIPKLRGYSIGFVYKPVDVKGQLDGRDYDGKQELELIDHIAVTNENRNPEAVATDSIGLIVGDCNEEVNKRLIGYDSYRDIISQNEVKAMADEKELLNEISSLKEELSRMKALEEANDAFAEERTDLVKEIDKLRDEIKTKTDAIAKFEKDAIERKEAEMQDTIEFLKKHEIKLDELPSDEYAFFEGIKWHIENTKKEPETDVSSDATDDIRQTSAYGGIVAKAGESTTHYRYDAKEDKFVLKEWLK